MKSAQSAIVFIALGAAVWLAFTWDRYHGAVGHSWQTRPPPGISAAGTWSQADEAAVLELMDKTGQELGGMKAALARGVARHPYTRAQLDEALRRQWFTTDHQFLRDNPQFNRRGRPVY